MSAADHHIIAEQVAGCYDADAFMRTLNDFSGPDELALLLARAAGLQAPPPRLSGFCRRIQKALERARR